MRAHKALIKVYGEIEMNDFDGLYLPLFAQLRTIDELRSALPKVRSRRMDEQLVIQALAHSIGLLDITNMSSVRQEAIIYIDNRYRDRWYHARCMQ